MPTTTGKATDFISFSRASNATVTDSDGKIKWAPHNLLLASESFDASAWGKYLTTVAANTQVAPNGTTTADTVTASAGNDVHRVQRASGETTAASTNYTLSVYVKAGTHNFVTIGHYGASEVFVAATFNLSSGSTATETDVGTTSGTVVSTEKVDIGSGWFRLSVNGSHSGTSSQSFVCFAQAATGNSYTNFGQPVVNLAGTETFHLWGAHLYRSDLGGMQANTSAYPMYNPTTPKNMLGYSEDFTTGWQRTGIAAFGSGSVSNAIVAPNGLQTADKIVPTAANALHAINNLTAITVVSGMPYYGAVYIKAAEYGFAFVSLNVSASSTNAGVCVNLADGTQSNAGGSGAYTITSAGDGWWRIAIRATASSANGYLEVWPRSTAGGPVAYAADGTSGVYLWGAQLSDSASLDAYVPSYGAAVTSAAYYGPRRDFDPVTLACKGLLVEEQRTNLLLHSAAFNNAVWTAYSSALSTVDNSAIGPDGLTSASTVTLSANSRVQIASVTSGATYTLSVWMRTDSGTKNITLDDINDGNTPLTVSVDTTWRRYSLTYTKANTAAYVGITQIAGTSPSTSGTLYVWGWQYEAGSFATSYIPTGSATATRNADVASVSTQAFPYSATEGTLVVSFNVPAIKASARYASLSSGESSRVLDMYFNSTTASQVYNGTTAINVGSITAGANVKVGAVYKTSDYAVSLNGGSATANTDALVNTANTLYLGRYSDGTLQLNGHIRQITYLPRRISNAELVTRSA